MMNHLAEMMRKSRDQTGLDDPRFVRSIVRAPWASDIPGDEWPGTIPAVAQVLAEGLDIPTGVTFLVGENGSGKSTLVEAIAQAYGLSPEGGSIQAVHSTRASESPLAGWIHMTRGRNDPRWGFFLRAETMHGFYTFLEEHPGGRDPVFHEMSHGESFLALVNRRLDAPGFYCLDEPEAALSVSSVLALIAALKDLASIGSQIICATHSPVLAALPGATILEVGAWGLRERAWDDLELVAHWKAFLDDPDLYLRHLLV